MRAADQRQKIAPVAAVTEAQTPNIYIKNMRQVLNRFTKLESIALRGMNDTKMRILNGMLSEASRYIGNVHCVVSEPSLDQAKEIDARLAELVSRIEAIRSTL